MGVRVSVESAAKAEPVIHHINSDPAPAVTPALQEAMNVSARAVSDQEDQLSMFDSPAPPISTPRPGPRM